VECDRRGASRAAIDCRGHDEVGAELELTRSCFEPSVASGDVWSPRAARDNLFPGRLHASGGHVTVEVCACCSKLLPDLADRYSAPAEIVACDANSGKRWRRSADRVNKSASDNQ